MGAWLKNHHGQDHPHAYGDKLMRGVGSARKMGSSPRVWGQVDADFTVDLSDRIIPTRMGTRGLKTLLAKVP